MFRPGRWRNDKNRVKAVFKLHFHVTQMMQSGVDALVLSIVPVDIGKATTRLEKAPVRGGICRWESPVYETVKLIQDPKSATFSERIYYFVLSTGLSKGSSIGEVSIDFADYAEASKPSSVSLPIKNSRSDAVLHVSIQRLLENNDKREEEEECEDGKPKPNDRSLRTYLSNGDAEETTISDSYEDISAKSNTNGTELSADCRTSSGSDITLTSSDGSSGLDTPRELGRIHPSESQKPTVNASTPMYDVQQSQRSQWGWLAGLERASSIDDSTTGSLDALLKEGPQQTADTEIERLKAELAALARQMDVSDMELQTLRKQIVKESKKGQELSKEIISLKEERDSLRKERDNLKSFQKRMDEAKASNRSPMESGDLRSLVEEIRQELSYEKDLNANLRLQLKKTQESNAELVLAVQDLDEMLEQKNKEISNLSNKHDERKNSHELRSNLPKCDTDDDEDQKELDELVKEQGDAKATHLLEQKILDLYSEIEMYRRDKDELEIQMEQLALDYEILKQENHDIAYKLEQSQLQEQLKMQYECSSPPPDIDGIETHIRSLENQLKKQSEESSNSLATIKALETQTSRLEEELEKQARGFDADLDAVTRDKIEQEQKAIQAKSHIGSLENQLEKQSEELSSSLATIKTLEAQISRLVEDLEKQAQGFDADLDAVTRDKIEQEQRAIQVKTKIESLQNQIEKQSEEFLNSLATIKALEAQISRLEEELEKQAQGFESDLDALSRNKIEQEQRAIRAEEALRKTRVKNANTAEKLQEEFKRLSMQMASTFDANEKATMKAMTEASELRAQKKLLEQMLHEAKQELQSAKADYEVKLNELSNQIDSMSAKIRLTLIEMEDKSKQLENQKNHEEQVSRDFSEEIQILKDENERLKAEILCFSQQLEQKEVSRIDLEVMKTSVEESEILLQKRTAERNELVITIILLKKEAEQLLEELNRMRDLQDEKETAVTLLRSELEELRTQYGDLKRSVPEMEAKEENFRKQVLQLKGELKKKDEALADTDKRLKDSNGCTQHSDGSRTISKNNMTASVTQNSKEMELTREEIRTLEGLIKSKETALEMSSSSFLEKERELQSKIEELEDQVDEFSQSIALQKVVEDKNTTVEHVIDTLVSGENVVAMSLSKSDVTWLVKEVETSIMDNGDGDGHVCDMSTELWKWKERNKSMESELKEMQERYSEMSLKFAEVEGERQKLVMTVRNLKNARKSQQQQQQQQPQQ